MVFTWYNPTFRKLVYKLYFLILEFHLKENQLKYHYSLKSKFIFITLLNNVICGINFSILIISNKIVFLVTVSIFPRYLPVVLDLCHLSVAFPIVNWKKIEIKGLKKYYIKIPYLKQSPRKTKIYYWQNRFNFPINKTIYMQYTCLYSTES